MKNEFEVTPKKEPIQTEQERILEALNKLQRGEVNSGLLNESGGTSKQEVVKTKDERILEALKKLQRGEINDGSLNEIEGAPKQEVVKTKEERILEAIEQLKWAEISDGLVVEREFEAFKKWAIDTYLAGDKSNLQTSLERRKKQLEEDLASGRSGKNQGLIINHGYKMIEAIQNFMQIVDGE